MKKRTIEIIAAGLLGVISSVASAQQTQACGKNMSVVKTIVEKMPGTFPAGYEQQLIGTWEKWILIKSVSFDIKSDMDFIIDGAPYAICPQTDQSFFLYKISDPKGSSGFARLTTQGIQIYSGHGKLAWAEGTFTRSAVEVAHEMN